MHFLLFYSLAISVEPDISIYQFTLLHILYKNVAKTILYYSWNKNIPFFSIVRTDHLNIAMYKHCFGSAPMVTSGTRDDTSVEYFNFSALPLTTETKYPVTVDGQQLRSTEKIAH